MSQETVQQSPALTASQSSWRCVQAHDREGLRRLPTLAARRLHLRSCYAEECRLRRTLAQGHNQVGTQGIARGFARQQTYAKRHGHA